MEGDSMWRYDIGSKENDKFEKANEDAVDLDGIKNQQVNLILFVGWTENKKVKYYFIYDKNKDDGKIYEYRMFNNGTVKEMVLE